MKLTIITINYNNAAGLQRTVDSVLLQTYADFEFIIVDGASTDGSKQILEHLQQEKQAGNILFPLTIISEPDAGIYNAMNKGIRLAKGEYLQFLNSGDYLTEHSILSQVFALANNADIIYGNRIDLQENGTQSERLYTQPLTAYFFWRTSLSHQASFIRRTLFDSIGMYREDLKFASDWEFFMKAILQQRVYVQYLALPICYYTIGGISSCLSMHEEMYAERRRVFEELFPYLVIDFERMDQYAVSSHHMDKRAMSVGKKVLYIPRCIWNLIKPFINKKEY